MWLPVASFDMLVFPTRLYRAAPCGAAGLLLHAIEGKTRDLAITILPSLQLLPGHDIFNAFEWPTSSALLNDTDDAVRRYPAVRQHDICRRRQPQRSGRRHLHPLDQQSRKRRCINNRLSRAVRTARHHRMRGIAEKRDTACSPER